MSVIIVPRRHYTQPQGRAAVAPEWAARSLTSCLAPMTGATYDAVSGRLRSSPSAINPTVTPFGIANRHSDKVTLSDWRPMDASSGVDLTLLVLANPTNGRATLISQRTALNENQIEIRLASNEVGNELANSVGFRANSDSGSTQFAVSSVLLDGEWRVFAGTCQSGVQCMYVNGVSGPPLARGSFASPSSTFTLAGLPDSTAIQYSRDIGLVAVFQSALTADEIAELSRNPWQLFSADPIRIYSLPSGPISWSSLTASNMTPTTATLTIGGITR